MNSNKIKAYGLAIVLALVLISALSLLAAIGNAGDVILPSNKVKNAFGGELLVNSNSSTYNYDACFDYIKGNKSGVATGSVSDNKITLSSSASSTDDHYWDIYLGDNQSVKLSDYSFMTVDFDIDMTNLVDRYRIFCPFRDEADSLAGLGEKYYFYIDFDEDLNKYTALLFENGDFQTVWESMNGVSHFTFAYSFNQTSLPDSVLNIYADGEFICSMAGFISNNAVYTKCLRIGLPSLSSLGFFNENKGGDMLVIENYQVNVFEKGYDGAINYLFDDPDITLQECSDSVLFED